MSLGFVELAEKLTKKQGRELPVGVPLLAFDPGHTTGWAVFHGCELTHSGQINTETIELATPEIVNLVNAFKPHNIVLESYRIYKWRAKHHTGSDLPTPRVIGCMETISLINDIPLFKQPAFLAKKFCTDEKLEAWGMYKKREKHARDAIRHGAYFILFGPIKGKGTKSISTVG